MNSIHESGSQTTSKNRLRNNTESKRIENRPSAPSAHPKASPRAQRPGRTSPALLPCLCRAPVAPLPRACRLFRAPARAQCPHARAALTCCLPPARLARACVRLRACLRAPAPAHLRKPSVVPARLAARPTPAQRPPTRPVRPAHSA